MIIINIQATIETHDPDERQNAYDLFTNAGFTVVAHPTNELMLVATTTVEQEAIYG